MQDTGLRASQLHAYLYMQLDLRSMLCIYYFSLATSRLPSHMQLDLPLELQIVSVLLREAFVVNAYCMNQESSPPYRVQIRIPPVHPRIGVVDGGRRHLVVIHVLRLCKC